MLLERVPRPRFLSSAARVISGSGRTARSLAERLDEIINVKDFGAVGAGGTEDDVTPFQDAGDVAMDGAGILFIPDGTYRLNSLVTWTNTGQSDRHLLVLMSERAWIDFDVDLGAFHFKGVGANDHLILSGIEGGRFKPFTGQGVGTAYAIHFELCNHVRCRDVQIDTLLAGSGRCNGVKFTTCFGGDLTDSFMNRLPIAINFVTDCNFIRITGNEIVDCTTDVIATGAAAGNDTIIIENNYFENNSANIINQSSTTDLNWRIVNNYFNSNTGSVEVILAGDAHIIQGNVFRGSTTGTNIVQLSSGSVRNIVSGNIFADANTRTNGIKVDGDNNIITDNLFQTIGTTEIVDTGVNNIIHGNMDTSGRVISNAFSAHKGGANQTGIVTATFTRLTWSNELYDPLATFDLANERWIPARLGSAEITAQIMWTAADDADILRLAIYKNGAIIKEIRDAASGTGNQSQTITITDDVTATTDFYEVFVQHTAAADKIIAGLDDLTFFHGHMID